MDTVDRISWLYRIDVRLQASTKDTTASGKTSTFTHKSPAPSKNYASRKVKRYVKDRPFSSSTKFPTKRR